MAAGSNGPDRETYLKFQAIAILDAEKAAALNKIKKSHRKDAELAGVPLQSMDWVIKTISLPVGEIASFFKEKLQLLAFNGVNISAKIDGIVGDMTEDQTFAGQLAGMQGKACSAPANLTPNEQQTFLAGWHMGAAARDEALAAAQVEEDAVARRAAAVALADPSTVAAQELGGDGYGDEGDGGSDGVEASTDMVAEPEPAAEPETPPHQTVKRTRAKATA